MTSGYGYKDFKAPPVRSSKDSLGPATAHSKNRGLAAMPTGHPSGILNGIDSISLRAGQDQRSKEWANSDCSGVTMTEGRDAGSGCRRGPPD